MKLGTSQNDLLNKLKVCSNCIAALKIREIPDDRKTKRVRFNNTPYPKSDARASGEGSFQVLVRDYQLYIENGIMKSYLAHFEPNLELFQIDPPIDNQDDDNLDQQDLNDLNLESNLIQNESDRSKKGPVGDFNEFENKRSKSYSDFISNENTPSPSNLGENNSEKNDIGNDVFQIGQLDDELLSNFGSEITPRNSQKTYASSGFTDRIKKTDQLYMAKDLGDDEKLCVIEVNEDPVCCFCRGFIDETISHKLTKSIIYRLEENGVVKDSLSFGDGFSIFFKDAEKRLQQSICFECLEASDSTIPEEENNFYRLNERIFRKRWLLRNNDLVTSNDFTGFWTVTQTHPDFDCRRISTMFQRLALKQQDEWETIYRGEASKPKYSPKFYFRGWKLFKLCGIDEHDLDELLTHLLDYENDRRFIRSLDIREAIIILFYFIRQNISIETLTALIMDKKSAFDVPFVIKPDTISSILYKTAYVLAGKNPFADLPKQFYSKFEENAVFSEKLSIGHYVDDYLGWDQNRIFDANFIFSESASIFRKLRTSRTSEEILIAYQNFDGEDDSFVKTSANAELAQDVAFYSDCTYLKTKRPGDIKFAQTLYSPFKGVHLSKQMVYCFSAGYIIDVSGSWYADGHHNDASILQIETKRNSLIRKYFDFWTKIGKKIKIICDRGFRDSVAPILNEFGGHVTIDIPPLQQAQKTSSGKVSQNKKNMGDGLSRDKANSARILSIERSIVENVNSLLKTFKFFDQRCELIYVFNGFQHQALRIVSSLFNRRYSRRGMLQRDFSGKICRLNFLKGYYVTRYEEGKCHRDGKLGFTQSKPEFYNFRVKGSKIWENIGPDSEKFDEFVSDFPVITYEPTHLKKAKSTSIPETDLIHLAIGEYHPKNAKKYLSSPSFLDDHFHLQRLSFSELSAEGRQELISRYPDWEKKDLQCVRMKMPAQFRPGHEHKVFVIYNKSDEIDENYESEPDRYFFSRIRDYYCDCFTGSRSFGCCSHVAAALLGARLTKQQRKNMYGNVLYADREILCKKTYSQSKSNVVSDKTVESSPKSEKDLNREKSPDFVENYNQPDDHIHRNPEFFPDEFNELSDDASEFADKNAPLLVEEPKCPDDTQAPDTKDPKFADEKTPLMAEKQNFPDDTETRDTKGAKVADENTPLMSEKQKCPDETRTSDTKDPNYSPDQSKNAARNTKDSAKTKKRRNPPRRTARKQPKLYLDSAVER